MGYRIEYDRAVGKYEIRKKSSDVFPVILCSVLIIAVLCACQSREVLISLLVPGEDVVTIEAFHAMTSDLRSGATLLDAFTDFCRLVIHGV